MQNQTGRPTLRARRMQGKSVMMHRIENKLIAIPEVVHLTRRETSTRGHYIFFQLNQSVLFSEIRFHQPHIRVLPYKHSFFPSAIRIWNSLPLDITEKPSLESFRLGLTTLEMTA